jgi:hypothetical protein
LIPLVAICRRQGAMENGKSRRWRDGVSSIQRNDFSFLV